MDVFPICMFQIMKRFLIGICVFALLSAVLADDKKKEEKKKADKDAVGTVIGIDLGTTYSW